MDERELANHVLELVDQTAYRQSLRKVVGVRLAIGGRRVIDLRRLTSMFDDVSRGTVAEGAELLVQVLPVRRHCRACGANFDGLSEDVPCPDCGHPHTEPIGGEEIRVLDIQVDDSAA